jgi:hypothetical protein
MSRHSRGDSHLPGRFLAVLAILAFLAQGCATHINDILREAIDGDPESVKVAVVELGIALEEKESAGLPYDAADEMAVLYLKDVATKSSDHLNRARALASLARLRRPDMTGVFLGALEDKVWIVRMEAAKGLAARPDPKAAGPLAHRLETEDRIEVRLAIIKALAATGGDESLRALLTVFLDRTNRWKNTKLVTYDAVRALSGKELRFEDEAGWQAYARERFGDQPESPPAGESPGTVE